MAMQLAQYPRRFRPYPPLPRRRRNSEDRYAGPSSLRKSAPNPATTSWLDGRRKPGPTDEDLAVLQSTKDPPEGRSLELSVEAAYNLAEKALKDHTRRRFACTNSNKLMSVRQKQMLPFRVFNELDAEFFRSVLTGNVSLGWTDLPFGSFSRTSRAGRKGNPRVLIELSPSLYRYGSRYDILAALIHQMIHAYYLQCCGFRNPGHTGEGHDLEHEHPFQALRKCVSQHCEVLRKDLSADLWVPHGMNRRTLPRDPTPGVSCCYGRGKRFNDVDIQDWRDVAAAKTKSLHEAQKLKSTGSQNVDRSSVRTVYSMDEDGMEHPPKSMQGWHLPSEACVFLRFDDRDYPVARSSVQDLTALTSSPCFREKSHLQLPPGTGEGEFRALYFFLVYRRYPPPLKDLYPALASSERSNQGPPKIKPYEVNAPTHLSQLITIFFLGKTLRYQPLCDFALKGLYFLQSTAEDPAAVLEKIYKVPTSWSGISVSTSTAPPDAQLREWTRSWLAVKLSTVDMSQSEQWNRSNLGVVRLCPSWSARYGQLKASNAQLKEDDSIAERALTISAQAQQPLVLPSYQHPMALQHPSSVARQFIYPNMVSSAQNKGCPPAHPGNESRFLDLSSLSQHLPEGHFQHPQGQPGSVAQPVLGSQDTEAYERWRRLQEEILRSRLGSQGSSVSPYDIFDQPTLSGPEQPGRHY